MGKFTAIEINALGEYDSQYGQRYWGRVEDSDMPVSFNLMSPVDIPIGADLEFEERVIKETGPKSKNPGSEYLFLRKVKVGGGIPRQTSTNAAPQGSVSSLEAKVDEILSILKKDAPSGYEQARATARKIDGKVVTANEDNVDYDIGDDPISLSDIPFN